MTMTMTQTRQKPSKKKEDPGDIAAVIRRSDIPFLKHVLPVGIRIYPDFLKCGGKFVTSLIAHKFPAYLDDLVFADLFNMPGVLVTFDVQQSDRKGTIKDIKRSVDELTSRNTVERSSAEQVENLEEQQDMINLQADVTRSNEKIFLTTLRFFLTADTLESLETTVRTVRDKVEVYGVEICIPEYELEGEYRTLTTPANTFEQPFPVNQTLSRQYPFYFSNHIDLQGTYFGYTATGGKVILDTFRDTDERKSFDLVLIGKKGSGKSATLKYMIQDKVSLGHKVLAIDIENEMFQLADKLGGKVITAGGEHCINPIQLQRSIVEGIIEGEVSNYASEISRIVTFLYQYAPAMTMLEAEEFKDILMKVYLKFGITDNTSLEALRPEQFPLFSDILAFIRDTLYISFDAENGGEIRPSLNKIKRDCLINLEVYIRQLAEGIYARYFNRHSTINVQNEQFVVFNLSSIADMEPGVYNAYLFSILTLMWQEVCRNRMVNETSQNMDDSKYVICCIDEAHRFLNEKNPHGLHFIENLARRSRKYESGLWFASQSILDFVSDVNSAAMDTIKNIFTLVQYKMILQQDSASVAMLGKVFGQLTASELAAIPSFTVGEMILDMGGNHQKIHCWCDIPQSDFAYFRGGR